MKPLVTAAALATLCAAAACTGPQGVRPRIDDTATGIGAIGGSLPGYLLGDVVGGRRIRGARAAGAGIGGLATAGIGAYMDHEERDLRARAAGTDVHVTRQGDDLLLSLPSSVTFAYASADVQPRFRRTLDQMAAVIAQYPQTYVDVYGHTDAVGGDAFNQELSDRRAGAVAAYLEADGVQPARIGTRGFGRTQPIASDEKEEGRAANRRIEIRLVPVHLGDAG